MSGSLESFAPRQELGGEKITQFNALQETKHQIVSEKHSMESLGSQEPGGKSHTVQRFAREKAPDCLQMPQSGKGKTGV